MNRRHHRAFSLIEVLLALALLSAVMVASALWIALAARVCVAHAAPNAWLNAAEATLDLMHDDIATGDFDTRRDDHDPPSPSIRSPPRVQVVDGMLTIRTHTTDPGAAVRVYRRDTQQNRLVLSGRAAETTSHEGSPRLLLTDVAAFECSIEPEEEILTVTIRRTPSLPSSSAEADGPTVRRRYALP